MLRRVVVVQAAGTRTKLDQAVDRLNLMTGLSSGSIKTKVLPLEAQNRIWSRVRGGGRSQEEALWHSQGLSEVAGVIGSPGPCHVGIKRLLYVQPGSASTSNILLNHELVSGP